MIDNITNVDIRIILYFLLMFLEKIKINASPIIGKYTYFTMDNNTPNPITKIPSRFFIFSSLKYRFNK